MMNSPSDTRAVLNKLRAELRAVRSGSVTAWPRIGWILDEAELRGYWEAEGAPSFTEWVRSLAHAVGRKERIFWRYLTAARFYEQQLRPLLLDRKVAVPPLTELPDGVSPEKLELLSKLTRVAPDEILEGLGRRVLEGEISRAELNRAWEAFRPALGGRTARGRLRVAPYINEQDPDQQAGQRKAIVCHGLQAAGPQWTGWEHPESYEVFLQVRPEPGPELPVGYVFDAVAVVVPQAGPVELHGVEVEGMISQDSRQVELTQAAGYCDYFWVARSKEAGTANWKGIPEGIGLLVDRGGRLEVRRQATRTPESGRYREHLLAGLLARVLGR